MTGFNKLKTLEFAPNNIIKDFIFINVYIIYYKLSSIKFTLIEKIANIFKKYNISIEHIPTGIDSISIVVSNDDVEKYKYEILTELKNDLKADTVSVQENISLIAIVGRNMAGHVGLSGLLFSVLGSSDINVKMIAQGPEELNIVLGIDSKDYSRTIKLIYDRLVK